MKQKLANLVLAVVIAIAAVTGYRLMRSSMEATIYRERLTELTDRYNGLRETYNQAVRRTAVTELIVDETSVSVSVRNAEGEIRRIETPYPPNREIFVDYVVVDGRLWIRRVFDSDTPPSGGVVIDPKIAHVQWDNGDAMQGKAAYRKLSPGRWVVTVTGNGSLGLVLRDGDTDELTAPPPVRDYPPTADELKADLDRISAAQVLKHALGG